MQEINSSNKDCNISNKQKENLVSVVMPIFNHPKKRLEKAIKSILNQSYQNIELIIVDGCKTNRNFEVIQRFNNPKISYYKACGYINCLNIGLEKAKGKYIARADSDDISYSNRIEKQVDFLEKNKNIDVCSCQTYVFGDVPNVITQFDYNVTFQTLIADFKFNHPFVMFRKELNLKYPPYKPAEDWVLFLDVIMQGHKIVNLPYILGAYRMNKSSIMRTFPMYTEFLIAKIQIYYLGLYYNIKLSFLSEILFKKHFTFKEILEFLSFTEEIMKHLNSDKKKFLQAFRLYFKYILNKSNNKIILYIILFFNFAAHRYFKEL